MAARGDLRVYYIPQVPGTPYRHSVPDLATAVIVKTALEQLSLFEYTNRIKPDYSDASGIERYEEDGDGGLDWFDVDPDDLPPGGGASTSA